MAEIFVGTVDQLGQTATIPGIHRANRLLHPDSNKTLLLIENGREHDARSFA